MIAAVSPETQSIPEEGSRKEKERPEASGRVLQSGSSMRAARCTDSSPETFPVVTLWNRSFKGLKAGFCGFFACVECNSPDTEAASSLASKLNSAALG